MTGERRHVLKRLPEVLLHRRGPRPPRIGAGAVITLRLAGSGDAAALERLAQLAGAAVAPGPALLAEVDDEACAVLPLFDREPLVDPFRPTAELRTLLAVRAAQLDRGDPLLKPSQPAELDRCRTAGELASAPGRAA